MDSFTEIQNQIEEAKEKRRELILLAMDGRTQRYVAEKSGVEETRLSKWINGFGNLENDELKKINHTLGTNF